MMIVFIHDDEMHHLKMGFARIGSIDSCKIEDIVQPGFDKKAMLRLYTQDEVYFVSDFTRFSFWKWTSAWDPYKSPDIVTHHNEWREHLRKNKDRKNFKKPIFEIMMDQTYFNGIGNFTRTEILARTRFSPFTTLYDVLDSPIMRDDFFRVAKETLQDIHRYGGMQFEHWRNPFGVTKEKFNLWIRCYRKFGKAYYMRDSKTRYFWFMKKWSKEYAFFAERADILDKRLLQKIYRQKET